MIGIYIIQCKVNNFIYTGKSKDIYGRWKDHKGLLNKNIHPVKLLQEDWNKYGKENFEFKIIEEFKEFNKEILSEKEIYYTKFYRSNEIEFGYNTSCGNSRKQSYETKIKIGLSHKDSVRSEESKLKMSKAQCGKKLSECAKLKLSIIGKNKIVSQETKLKMSNSHKNHKVSKETRLKISKITIEQSKEIKEKLNRGEYYKDLAKEFNVSYGTIGKIKLGKHWTCKEDY